MPSFLSFFHALGRERGIPSNIRLTALIIGGHAKPVSGDGAYPSIRTIGKKAGLSRSTVDRAIDWLQAHGWLELTPHTGYGKGWRRNRYRLVIPGKTKVSQPVGHEAGAAPYIEKDNVSKNGSRAHMREKAGAGSAWKRVMEAVQRFGAAPGRTDERVAFLGDRIMAALNKIGGFIPAVCRANAFDLKPGGPVYRQFAAALAEVEAG